MSVLLAVPSLLFSTTIDQPQVHLIKDQLNLIKFDDNDNDDNFDNDGHDEVINSEPIKMKFEVETRTNWPRKVRELILDSNSWSQGLQG